MNDKQNPWGGNVNNNQTPPDLDEAINELKNKFANFFGGKKPDDAEIIDDNNNEKAPFKFKFVIILALIVWLASGFYIIDPAEEGVVLRFGEKTSTVGAGPHWHLPAPIEKVEVVNVSEVRIAEIGFRTVVNSAGNKFSRSVPTESIMLTSDGNIINASFEIQYTINDAQQYLFNVSGPEKTLDQVANSAIREVIGKHKMDYIITEGRGLIASKVKDKSQELLDFYQVGLKINTVNFKSAQAPDQVQAAYSDVTKAKTDKERYINQAQSYANDILPKARGASARLLEEANAYKAETVAKADGETSRFLQILNAYSTSKEVTRERLYRETMEGIFANTSKIITSEGNNSMMYLPIDKLINSQKNNQNTNNNQAVSNNQSPQKGENIRNAFRNSGGR